MIDVVDIPSKFVPYGNKVKIVAYPYTMGDLEKISKSIVTLSTFYSNVLEGIETYGMDKNDLTLDDFYYLALLRKLRSLGNSIFKSSKMCSCGHSTSFSFSIGDIDFEEFKIETPRADITFRTIEDIEVIKTATPLKIGRYIEILDIFKPKDIKEPSVQEIFTKLPLTYIYAAILEGDIKENHDFINNQIPSSEYEKIETVYKAFSHGLKPIKVKCDKCGLINEAYIERRDTIINPFRPDKNSINKEIRFY